MKGFTPFRMGFGLLVWLLGVQGFCCFPYGFWTPCLAFRSSREVTDLYKGLALGSKIRAKTKLYLLCVFGGFGVSTIERKREQERKCFFLLFLFLFGQSENWV
jgi:hypothetical protein